MPDDIIGYGRMDPDGFPYPDEVRDFLYEVARENGFVNVEETQEVDVEAGLTARTGDAIQFNPDYIDSNALTYLDPELMKRKVETEVEFLRGTYESHYDLNSEMEREAILDELSREIDEIDQSLRQNLHEFQEGQLEEDELIDRNKELDEEKQRKLSKLDMVNRSGASQGYLFMVNKENSDGKDPVEAIAVNAYNPFMYSKDDLEGFFEVKFREDFPWLNEEAREEVIETVEDINRRLERRAEEFEI